MQKKTNAIDYNQLDPGIRETVKWLNSIGFRTTDSGDGVSKSDMECAMCIPNVAIETTKSSLIDDTDYLDFLLLGSDTHQIQASYDPRDGTAIILLLDFDDGDLERVFPWKFGETKDA